MAASQLDVGGMFQGASLLTRPADEFENDGTVEALWVRQACEHADVYYNLITSVNPLHLKLTPHDDRVHEAFTKRFPMMNLQMISEDDLKSDRNKIIWREFCEEFKDVEDYSFGTLLRLDVTGDFSEENTILVTRIQFLAIETARNRGGYNNLVWTQHSKEHKEGDASAQL